MQHSCSLALYADKIGWEAETSKAPASRQTLESREWCGGLISQFRVSPGRKISTPTRFDITQRTPANIYYAAGQGLPYSQYASITPSETNDLWIQGAGNWSQYVVVPVGTWLQLVANVATGGPGGFYEIVQTNNATLQYNAYQFYQGYNNMSYNADQVGRHMLYYVV